MACWDCCITWVNMQEEKEARMLAHMNALEQELSAEHELVAENQRMLLTTEVLCCLDLHFVLRSDLHASLYCTCRCVASLALWCAIVRHLVCSFCLLRALCSASSLMQSSISSECCYKTYRLGPKFCRCTPASCSCCSL